MTVNLFFVYELARTTTLIYLTLGASILTVIYVSPSEFQNLIVLVRKSLPHKFLQTTKLGTKCKSQKNITNAPKCVSQP